MGACEGVARPPLLEEPVPAGQGGEGRKAGGIDELLEALDSKGSCRSASSTNFEASEGKLLESIAAIVKAERQLLQEWIASRLTVMDRAGSQSKLESKVPEEVKSPTHGYLVFQSACTPPSPTASPNFRQQRSQQMTRAPGTERLVSPAMVTSTSQGSGDWLMAWEAPGDDFISAGDKHLSVAPCPPLPRPASLAPYAHKSSVAATEELWDAIRWGIQASQKSCVTDVAARRPTTTSKRFSISRQTPQPNRATTSSRQREWDDRMLRYMGQMTKKKLGRRASLESLESYKDGCLSSWLQSTRFAVLVTFAVLMNAVFIGVEVQEHMRRALHSSDFEKPQAFMVINVGFAVFFAIEVGLSICAYRMSYFVGPGWRWNMFDLLLVLISVVELALGPETGTSRGYVRLVRVLRLARALRLIRIVRFFRELRCMCMSIVSNFVSLAWAFVLLFILIYIFAIIFMQAGVSDLETTRENEEEWRRWYGSLSETMYTLTKSVSGGENWNGIAEPLGAVSFVYKIAFIFYILFILFGALNVFTGVFLQKAMESMAQDRDWLTQAQNIKLETFVMNLVDLFNEMDLDSSGTLTWHKFMIAMDNPRTQAFFMSHDLDIADAHLVFNLMAGSDGTVNVSDFVKGCSQAKGFAKSAHIMNLMRETEEMHTEMRNGFEAVLNSAGQVTNHKAKGSTARESPKRRTSQPPSGLTTVVSG